MPYIMQITPSIQVFACIKFCHRNIFCAVTGSLYFERINVHAGSDLFKNLFNFEISLKEFSKDIWSCFQKKTPEAEKRGDNGNRDGDCKTDSAIIAIDWLTVYLEYIKYVTSNQVFSPTQWTIKHKKHFLKSYYFWPS